MGSGLRASLLIAGTSDNLEFCTYANDSIYNELAAISAKKNIKLNLFPAQQAIAFAYFHPLSTPRIISINSDVQLEKSFEVQGDVILRYSFIEGDAVVHGNRVVYDPQSKDIPDIYQRNGSTANTLAIVLNEDEVYRMTNRFDLLNASITAIELNNADLVIVKRGIHGAFILLRSGNFHYISPYRSFRVFKIGTGDVFSAAFSYYWGMRGIDALEAAKLASRSVAFYNMHTDSCLQPPEILNEFFPIKVGYLGKIGIIGSVQTLGNHWLMEETYSCLISLGGVPRKYPDYHLMPSNIEDCSAIFILADTFTDDLIFNVLDILPSVNRMIIFAEEKYLFLSESIEPEKLFNDFTSALYHVTWLSGL